MMKYFRTRLAPLPVVALLSVVLAGPAVFAQYPSATISRVALQGNETGLQLEIRSNIPVATETQALAGPDRIVIDFLGASPGNALRGFVVNQQGIRRVRVGLFEANPPRTRVVIDLERPIEYRVASSGNAVLVKLGSSAASLVSVSARTPRAVVGAKVTPPQPPPPLQVSYNNGLLWVDARKATLAEVLYQVHLRTCADIPIPAGAEQEQVVMTAGPGPAKDVLAAVLNGSRFNFVLVGTAQDQNSLRSVILTPKMDGGFQQVMTATPPVAAPQPQPEPEIPQPEQPQPDQLNQQYGGPSQRPENEPVMQAPADQGQTMAPPTAPPPPPTQDPNAPPDQNRQWTEPPPTSVPQPD
jgi:hypothetical protein